MRKNRSVRSLRVTVVCSLLVAMSVVCGKFLQLPVGEVLRFSLENLPILFAGMAFGPLCGMVVGVLADSIGCLAVGYTINPLVTCGAAVIGLVGGLMYRLSGRLPRGVRVAITVAAAHFLGSVVVKTIGLAAYYAMPVWALGLWRLLNYTLVGIVEGLLLHALLKNKAIVAMTAEVNHDV